MAGARGRRRRRRVLLAAAGGLPFLGLSGYALQRAAAEGLAEAAPVDLLALAVAASSLIVSVIVWRTDAAADPEGQGRALAAGLARQVLDAEAPHFLRLVGGDTRRINLAFVRSADESRAAETPHTAGAMVAAADPPISVRAQGELPDISTFYRNTRPRRMVITGDAGAGKTALAVELLLALIEDRQDDDPVPLRLTLAQWNVRRTLDDFLVSHLVTAYGRSRAEARTLVRQGRVLPVLDGLDEMDPTLPDGAPAPGRQRARAALDRLNRAVRGRHPAPVVVTCRTAHYESLPPRARLWDATRVEVAPVDAGQACAYLAERAVDVTAWQPVLDAVRAAPTGPLARTLSNPWRLSLAATVFARDGDPADLLAHATPRALDAYLLARLVPAATALAPDPHRYAPEDTERWLTRLARHLSAPDPSGTRGPGPGVDIVLHRLWPVAGTTSVRCLHVAFILCGAVAFADFAIGTLHPSVLVYAAIVLVVMLRVGTKREVEPKQLDIGKLFTWAGLRKAGSGLVLGLPVAAGIGVLFGVTGSLARGTYGAGFLYATLQGFSVGLLIGPVLGLARGVSRNLPGAPAPRDPLRADLLCGLAVGLIYWLGYGLAFWPVYTFLDDVAHAAGDPHFFHERGVGGVPGQYAAYGPAYGFSSGALAHLLGATAGFGGTLVACAAGLLEAVLSGLALCSAAWTRYAIAAVLAARRGDLPRHPGAFCDWAYDAGLLRVSGIAYQFRHLELQRWLARHGSGSDGQPGPRAPRGPMV